MTLRTSPEIGGMGNSLKRKEDERCMRGQGKYGDDGKLTGAVSWVARYGRVVHYETYGRMDDEADKPVAADTIFRI